MRREGDLSREHLIVVLFHPLLNPGLQIWIAEIGDQERRLLAGAKSVGVAHAGVGGIIAHERRPAGTPWNSTSNVSHAAWFEEKSGGADCAAIFPVNTA